MIFNTAWFFLFFPLVIALLWAIPGRMARFYFLLAASAVFHTHFAGPAGVAPIVAMAVAVFYIALRMEAARDGSRKAWLWLGLCIPVAGLIWYKYRVFLLSSLFGALPALEPHLKWLSAASPMPLAISFFTFEFVHYITDIYKGGKALRKPQTFALFCIYFPSIVSGPIKRYENFNAQVETGLAPLSRARTGEGLAQICLGLFKKMVVADNANMLVGLMDARPDWQPWHVAVLMFLLSVRILFDFSGYSDIAIGLSKVIGLDLPANFNWPYLASDIQDFWRRWHMSLSSWIRDYIYIPLGGSRQGAFRKSANGLIAMALCGLWHGAAWNFMGWGVYHGLGLAAHGVFRKRWPDFGRDSKAWTLAAHGLTLLFVAYGWLLFFYPLERVGFLTRRLFGL